MKLCPPVLLLLAIGTGALAAIEDPPDPKSESQAEIDVLAMTAVPDGNYLVNIDKPNGVKKLINYQDREGRAEAVTSTAPDSVGLKGAFQAIGNGVFLISVSNRQHRGTLFWVFRPDGGAQVKEVPAREEKQFAVPVRVNTQEYPDKKKAAIALGSELVERIGFGERTKRQKVKADFAAFDVALKLYKLDGGTYPSTAQGLGALVEKPTVAPVPKRYTPKLDALPLDPWGNPYGYRYPPKHNQAKPDVFSMGPDGKAETQDDLGNWGVE